MWGVGGGGWGGGIKRKKSYSKKIKPEKENTGPPRTALRPKNIKKTGPKTEEPKGSRKGDRYDLQKRAEGKEFAGKAKKWEEGFQRRSGK